MKHHLTILIQNATLIRKMVMEGILIHFNWEKKIRSPEYCYKGVRFFGKLKIFP